MSTFEDDLLKERIIFLSGGINTTTADIIIQKLLYLDSLNNRPITMYINSPGGSVDAGLVIKNTMDYIKSPVHTIATATAASMGAVLLASGERNHRFALKDSMILIHQPLLTQDGTDQISDIEIRVERGKYLKKKVNKYLSDSTYGKIDEKRMEELCDRDRYLTSEEAIELGLIDGIVERKE